MADLNQQVTDQFLGEIGFDVPAWLQNYLVEVRGHIQRLTTDPTQPGGVLGLTVTKNNLGNLISWSAPVVGAAYQVFRNSSGDFTTATQIAELQGHNNISFFDGVDQLTAAQTRYYWVRALNAAGLGGPISAVATSTNFAADGTSTAVGVDAVAAGSSGTAVGRSATSGTGSRNTAIGVSSTIGGTGTDCTAVGQNASITGGNFQTAIGAGAVTSLLNCTAVGAFSSATGTDGTAMGAFATTGSGLVNVAIGWSSQCGSTDANTAVGALCVANGGNTVAVGKTASAQGAFSAAVGAGCAIAVGADRSTGIGYNVVINHADCVVIGKDGASTTSNQVIIGTGSSIASDIWFGRGVTHSGAPAGVIIHATDGTGTNVGGDNILLQGGQPTGNGGPGIIAFYTSIAGASGSILRTAAERMRVHTNGYVGIGTTSPDTLLHLNGNTSSTPSPINNTYLHITGGDSEFPQILIDSFGKQGLYYSRRANGTAASKSALVADDIMFQIAARGYGATGYCSGGRAEITGNAVENWSDTAQGTYLRFFCTPATTTTLTEYMQLSSAGFLNLKNAGGPTSNNAVLNVVGNGAGTPGIYTAKFDVAQNKNGISIGVGGTSKWQWYLSGSNDLIFYDDTNSKDILLIAQSTGNTSLTGSIAKYNSISTEGLGVHAIYKKGRSTAQTAAVASVAAYTNGATDGSFIISANANVTTSTTHNFTVTVAYTDETNTARTLTLSFFALSGGAPISSITNITGAGPYEGAPVHIRCKASTSITIATTGTFTSVTYNVEGYITQIG